MLQTKQAIGRLDERITFQEKLTLLDVSNADQEIGWSDIADKPGWWCTWSDNPGNEVIQAEQLVGVQISAIICRKRQVDIKWRILKDGRPFEIISVQEVDRRYIRILVKSGQQYVEAQT